jgi:adenylyltransferase/sulfurtransferase
LVSGAGVRFDGQVTVFDMRKADSPCYHCLFPESGDMEEMRCAVMGVFAPLVGIIGSIQAAEALKLLMGTGRDLTGRLLLLDALTMEWRNRASEEGSSLRSVRQGDTAQRATTESCARINSPSG